MEEGESKFLAQMKLNQKKERTELERRQKAEEEAERQRQMAVFNAEQDQLAAGNKKYAKKIFRDSDIKREEIDKIKERYAALFSDLDSAQKKSEQDRLQASKESMNAYLKEFGSYQQKRVAINEEYGKRISEAQNEGERLQFMANRNKALADLDFNEWQGNGGMALAFGDIEKLSNETISQLISDMEKYRSKIIATFDPDKIKTFEDALNNLRMAEMSDGFFGDNEILSSIQERLSVQKQLADEEAKEIELKRKKAELEFQLSALQMGGSTITLGHTPEGEEIKSEPILSEEETRRAEELRVKLDAANRAIETSAKNSRQLKSQLDKLGKIKFADIQEFSNNLLKAGSNASSLASTFSDDLSESIGTATDTIGGMFDAFSELSSNINALAKSAQKTVEKTVDATSQLVEGASEGMKASAAATSGALNTLEKASSILAIIGAAIQLATLVSSLFNKDKQ
ncbi:MAG: hypothetical protein K2H76_04965, partial [Muribaculaceae bacterium]|nr:hypothetical protein [Muribaculaceae bacterium]